MNFDSACSFFLLEFINIPINTLKKFLTILLENFGFSFSGIFNFKFNSKYSYILHNFHNLSRGNF